MADEGKLREADYTFFWRGKASNERRIHGVGFAVRNTLLNQIVEPSGGSERLLRMSLHTTTGTVNLISVYAPTQMAESDTKDQFYDDLDRELRSVPATEEVFLLGDFNARVGSDREAWPDCLGSYGVGKMNDNGQRLLELCTYYGFCISNTFFKVKPLHRASWKHPRSGHWHQLDMIITRRASIGSVIIARSYHSADCDTDYALVRAKLRMVPRKPERNVGQSCRRADTSKLNNPLIKQELLAELHTSVEVAGDSIEKRWSSIRDAICNCTNRILGPCKRPRNDLFEENLLVMQPIIEVKRMAFLAYKRSPSAVNLASLREARSATQRVSRECANKYWLDLCQQIQKDADTGNIRGMYEGMRKAFGPLQMKRSPIKSKDGEVLKTREEQMLRWIEHYLDIYSNRFNIEGDTQAEIIQMPTLYELDSVPTPEELEQAIDTASAGKSPGLDGIAAETIKHCKGVLLDPLHELLAKCWETGELPQSFKNCDSLQEQG